MLRLFCLIGTLLACWTAHGQTRLDSLIEAYLHAPPAHQEALFETIGNSWNTGESVNRIANLEERMLVLESKGDTTSAIRLGLLLLTATEKAGNYELLIYHGNRLCTLSDHLTKREYGIAIGMLKVANRKIGRLHEVLVLDAEARAHNVDDYYAGKLWEVYYELGLTREAINSYRATMRDTLHKLRPFNYSSYLNNLGVVFSDGGELDSAMYFFEAASGVLDSLLATGRVEGVEYGYAQFFAALVKGNIAEVYIATGQYEQAIPLIEADIEKSFNYEVPNAMGGLLELAVCLQALNRHEESLQHLLRVDSLLSNGIGFYSHSREVHQLFAQAYQAMGQHQLATQYYVQLTQLEDSVKEAKREENAVRAISNYELRLSRERLRDRELQLAKQRSEAEQRKGQRNGLLGGVSVVLLLALAGIALARQASRKRKILAEKNIQIEAQAAQIKTSLKDKERLLREIHHRIKNNLQIVGGILKMHARKSSNAEVDATMEEARNKLQVIALIHQQLYQSEGLSNIPLQDYLERLVNKLLAAMVADGQHVQATLDCGTHAFDANTTVPLGLMVNEVITNSLKYGIGNASNGQLHLSLTQPEPERYVLRIADNGPGFSADFDPTSNKSLGTLLINGLSGQLNGRAEYSNEEGAVVSLFFHPDPDESS